MEELKSLMNSKHGKTLIAFYEKRVADMKEQLVREEEGIPTEALKQAIQAKESEITQLQQLTREYTGGVVYGDNE